MALQVLDFVKFKLASSFNPSTDTTVTIIAESDIYTLALQRQGVDVSNFRLTIVEKTDTSQFIRVSVGSIASQSTVDGKLQYVCNIEDSDASNPMVGLANDDDGTNGDANIIAGNVSGLTITEFSTDSVCMIAVGSAEYNELKGVFTAGTTTNTAEAGEDIEALDSVSLHTDGKLYEYHSTNYPNLVGAVSTAYATAATATYTTFGGVSTGHSGLTVGATQYAEDTGSITETSSTTTTMLGTAESATTIRVAKTGDPVAEASQAQAEAGTAQGVYISPLRAQQHHDELLDTAETLENKTLKTNCKIAADATDVTKTVDIDASGITTGTNRTITMPDADVDLSNIGKTLNLPIVDVRKSGSQNVLTTYELITGWTEELDAQSNFASDQFTAPLTGTYRVDYQIDSTAGNSTTVYAVFMKNASTEVGSEHRGTDGTPGSFSGHFFVVLTAADTLDLRAKRDGINTTTILAAGATGAYNEDASLKQTGSTVTNGGTRFTIQLVSI